MSIRILGAHNCESRDSHFVCLLIDDVLAIDAGALTSSLSFKEQQELKAILLTHQHYDHIRDVPAIAINHFLQDNTIDVYSTQTVYDAVTTHLLNDRLYPDFLQLPVPAPAVRFTIIEPYRPEEIDGYSVLAVPVHHSKATVGYQITSADGKVMFYTADTGSGLASCWERVSPQLLFVEVTVPNRLQDFAVKSGHLTPALLSQELADFRQLKGYLPPVILVHMSPIQEEEIESEIAEVAKELNSSITLAHEGMQLQL